VPDGRYPDGVLDSVLSNQQKRHKKMPTVRSEAVATAPGSVIERNTHIVHERPVITASLEQLTVRRLAVSESFSLPDPSIFYPPHPEELPTSHLVFRGSADHVELRTGDGHAFFQYDCHKNVAYTEHHSTELLDAGVVHSDAIKTGRLEATEIIVPSLNVPSIRTERLETLTTEIGGILLREGTLAAPRDALIGQHLTAKSAAVGGVSLREETVTAAFGEVGVLGCDTVRTELLEVGSPALTLGGVQLHHGNVECRNVRFEGGTGKTLVIENVRSGAIATESLRVGGRQIFVKDGTLVLDGGIATHEDSKLGPLWIGKEGACLVGQFVASSVEASNVTSGAVSTHELVVDRHGKIGGVVCTDGIVTAKEVGSRSVRAEEAAVGMLSATTANVSNVVCTKVTSGQVVAESVTSKDYRLSDGTSILNGIFPPGMIMLFAGGTPPRGWLMCNGTGGTPLLPPPAPGVIYIVRR